MFKHLLRKLLGSVVHSKHNHYRRSSSGFMGFKGPRHSSDSHYGHKYNGHGYYKNFRKSSS
jgi:hypothetical protein